MSTGRIGFREKGPSMTPSAPASTWPDLRWSSTVPANGQIGAPSDLAMHPFGGIYFDSLRITVWAPKEASSPEVDALGEVLKARFDDTDLLAHLAPRLEPLIGRSLSREEPNTYRAIRDLYVARYHVAHGRPAIVRDSGTVRRATDKDVKGWHRSSLGALKWIESLAAA